MGRLLLYTEDPPLRDGLVATGLSRVNRHIVRSLASDLAGSVLGSLSIRRGIVAADLDPLIADSLEWAVQINSPKARIAEITRRAIHLTTRISAPRMAAIRSRFQGMSDLILTPVGTNVAPLRRALQVGESLGVPVLPYLVDDPVANAKIGGQNAELVNRSLRQSLANCLPALCVSEGLAQEYSTAGRLELGVAPLPFESTCPSSREAERCADIVFIGNASHFYQDGLLDCAAALSSMTNPLRRSRLVCTIGGAFIEKLRELYPSVVEVRSCDSDEDLRTLIASAACAFVPYSFDSQFRPMVTTSYPSKMLECLASARRILVYAPEDSTVAIEAGDIGFETLLVERSAARLGALLRQIVDSNQDFSTIYVDILRRRHGYDGFRRKVARAGLVR